MGKPLFVFTQRKKTFSCWNDLQLHHIADTKETAKLMSVMFYAAHEFLDEIDLWNIVNNPQSPQMLAWFLDAHGVPLPDERTT